MEQQPRDFDRIAPAPVTLGGTAIPAGTSAPRSVWPIATLGALAGIVLFVILVLPHLRSEPAPLRTTSTAAAPAPQAVVAPAAPEPRASAASAAAAAPAPPLPSGATDDARLAARGVAQELLERVRELDANLKRMSVESWAAADYANATARASAAERAYLSLDYPGARDGFRAAISLFEALLQRAEAVFSESMTRGNAALTDGHAGAAASAFRTALAIRPDDAGAWNGARRAETIDKVMALMREGDQLVHDGDMAGAAETFRKAGELDPDFIPARERLQSVRGELASRAFRSAMSAGFAALESGQTATARGHFAEALRIRPGAPEAQDALRQAETRLTSAAIERSLAAAAAAEQSEEWGVAVREYETALKLDTNLLAARAGLETATSRRDLDLQLTQAIARPERLADDAVHVETTDLLTRVARVPAPGPRLRQQAAVLDRLLQESRMPIPVMLTSDGETDVTVYRLGNLGRFTGKEITLRPGRHVIIGTRAGFRDVRVEVTLAAGAAPPPVDIRCTESIGAGR